MQEEDVQTRDQLDTLQEVIALLQNLRQYHSQIGDRHIEALEHVKSKLAEQLT